MIQLICNEIRYYDKVLTQTYMSQRSEFFLFAIWLLLIFLLPCKFKHEPYCVGRVLVLDCYKLHYKKLDHLPLNLTLSVFNLVISQIDTIDSILLKYNQNLVSNQKQIVGPMHNSPKIMVHCTINLQVNDVFEHKELQCIFQQFI